MDTLTPQAIYRAEKDKALRERRISHVQLMAEAQEAFRKLLADAAIARKGGRPKSNPGAPSAAKPGVAAKPAAAKVAGAEKDPPSAKAPAKTGAKAAAPARKAVATKKPAKVAKPAAKKPAKPVRVVAKAKSHSAKSTHPTRARARVAPKKHAAAKPARRGSSKKH